MLRLLEAGCYINQMERLYSDSINSNYSNSIEVYLQDLNMDSKGLRNALTLSRNQLNFLRSEVNKKDFESEKQEIHFFKHIKPIPLSHLIYFLKIQKYLGKVPGFVRESKRKFILHKLTAINRFTKKHAAFSLYISQGQSHLDAIYFTRASAHLNPFTTALHTDPDFSTSHDTILAKHMAMRHFGRYLTYQMDLLEHNPSVSDPLKPGLTWTGPKVDLVELIYALQSSGVFDHGNSSVKKIASYFEAQFNCPLGDYYRSYSELRYRKKSRTKFLDLLSEQLQKKMDLDDA